MFTVLEHQPTKDLLSGPFGQHHDIRSVPIIADKACIPAPASKGVDRPKQEIRISLIAAPDPNNDFSHHDLHRCSVHKPENRIRRREPLWTPNPHA